MNEEPKTLKEIDDLKYRVSIDELKLGDNYKEVKRESVDKLKRSLLDDDQLLPILTDARIDHDGVIIGGYHQYFAIKELIDEGKWLHGDRVWVEPRTPKDDKHAKILALKHNTQYDIATTGRLAEYGADLIDSEYLLSDILVITDYQVISLIDIMDRVGPETEVTEDESPEVDDSVEPTSQLGRVYQLGRHRLMCGDSTKIEDVEKLMNGQKADMVFTDPPYSVNYAKKNKEILGSDAYTEIENDNLSVEQTAKEIWKPVFDNLAVFSNDHASIYVTMPQGGDQMMMMMMMDSWKVKHELIWVKPSPVFSMGRLDYDYKHEPILYGWKKTHRFFGKGKHTKSVWEIGRDGDKSHPTMKPVELVANCLMNSTEKDDTALDLFGGSGSTLIACEQLDRTCYMMEIDPKYCDVIRKRYAKFIGKEDTWENESPIVEE